MKLDKIRSAYKKAKASKVGESCICPSCGSEFVKTNYQQAFCKKYGGTVCKDKYWNTVTPEKRNNTTRISPANKRYLDNRSSDYGEHPFSEEGLGQWLD